MDVSIIHLITDWFPTNHASDLAQISHGHLSFQWPVLAQYVHDADLLGQIQKTFNNFVKTGQVWALLIGIVLGYLIRGITA